MQFITSRNNEQIKNTVRLQDRKERANSGMFFIEGIHLACEYVKHCGEPLKVFVTQSALEKYREFLCTVSDERIFCVTDSVFEKISTENAPQGILCVCSVLSSCRNVLPEGGLLFLESVRDAGNLGTVIRTALGLGVKGVVLSSDCADLYNPKTLRASMGAVFAKGIFTACDFYGALKYAKQYGKLYATALHDDSLVLGEFKIGKSDSFIIGNEGSGVSDRAKGIADGTVFIPMSGKTESLNASAAAAIIIWEMSKVSYGY